MSSNKLKQATKYIVNRIGERNSSKKNESQARQDAQKHPGQILVMNGNDQASMLYKHFNIALTEDEINEMMALIHTFLQSKQAAQIRKLQAIAGGERVKNVLALLKSVETKSGDMAYLTNSFEVAKGQKIRKGKAEEGQSVSLIQANYVNNLKRRKNKKQLTASEISGTQQLGHGDRGASVSQFSMDRAIAEAVSEYDLSVKQEAQLRQIANSHREKQKMTINISHGQIFTSKGKFKKDYAFILSYQDKDMNAKDQKKETAANKEALKEYNLLGKETSTLVPDAIGQTILYNLAGKKRKNKKVKGKKARQVKESSNASSKEQYKKTVVSSYIVQKGVSGKGIKKNRQVSKAKTSIASQPLHLIGLINKELPDTVRKNMRAPGLENRTGRFAESVKITDVIQTPKGFPSFGYTYQKNPYQVFEMGRGQTPWASPERDPRQVIDRSIREIAAQFAIGRFYTRRE